MNMVTVIVYAGGVRMTRYETDDVNRAMTTLHAAQKDGWMTMFMGPYGERFFEPPIEEFVNQFPDDSQARHDRNRARQKLP